MPGLRYQDVVRKGTEVLDLTSLTPEELTQLVPPFEQAFQERMAIWRLDGHLRTQRHYTTYQTCPLPTPENRLFFILVYLKTHPLQIVQGRLFGMPQNKASQWIHCLLPVLQTTLQHLGDAPARSLADLTQRLAMPMCAPDAPAPLFVMMAPSGASHAPTLHPNRRAGIAARKNATPSKISSSSMPR